MATRVKEPDVGIFRKSEKHDYYLPALDRKEAKRTLPKQHTGDAIVTRVVKIVHPDEPFTEVEIQEEQKDGTTIAKTVEVPAIGQLRVPRSERSWDWARFELELRAYQAVRAEERFPELGTFCGLKDCWKLVLKDSAYCSHDHRDMAENAHMRSIQFQ